MPDREGFVMGAIDVLILILYTLGISLGQVQFKMAADHAREHAAQGFATAMLGNLHFYAAIVLYAALTVVWVWLLTRIPLSRAYPFVVLSFVFTPLLAALWFGEALNLWYFAGLALIVAGLALILAKAA